SEDRYKSIARALGSSANLLGLLTTTPPISLSQTEIESLQESGGPSPKSLTYGIRRVFLTAHETAGIRPERPNNSPGSSVRRTPCRPIAAASFHDRPMLDNGRTGMVAGAPTPRPSATFLRPNCRDHHPRSDVRPAAPPRRGSGDRRGGGRRSG